MGTHEVARFALSGERRAELATAAMRATRRASETSRARETARALLTPFDVAPHTARHSGEMSADVERENSP